MIFARRISDQVIYFEGGQAVGAGTQEEVFGNPQRPEARAFMESFRDDEPKSGIDNNGAVPRLNVSTGTRGNLGQEEKNEINKLPRRFAHSLAIIALLL